jgi:hypothetical protein
MKYDHAKPLIERLMHVAVLYHMSPGMLRTKIFDALKEFIPDMDDGCFERGCPAIDHFAAPVQASDEFKEMVEKGTKAWADTPDDWVDDLRGGAEPVGYVSESGKGAYLLVGVGLEDDTPLYAAPLKKEWVGLTDHELQVLDFNDPERGKLARAVEAKLKERNT